MISNAIFTPRGLHVRLPTHVAFALMAQLRPKVRPSKVLATTEAIEFTPTALSKLLALVGFLLMRRADPRFRQPLSSTERFFLDALRLHAAGSAQHLDLEHLPVTAEDGPWRAALADYAAEYPDRARQSFAGDSREAPR